MFLRRHGSSAHGITTWYVLRDDDFSHEGLLDPTDLTKEQPFRDFYQVLWFFERVQTTLQQRLVNQDVLFETIGFHCWWWSQLLERIASVKAVSAVQGLGPQAASWAAEAGEYDRWQSHCMTDFDGGGPRPLPGSRY